MTADENKVTVRRFIEQLVDDFVGHTWPSTGHPKDDLRAAIERTSKGLSDPSFTIEDLIAEGGRVAVRLTAAATQTGELMGMPASNRRYEIGEIHIFRLTDGKVVEHWHQFDQMAMMRQLGAIPGGAAPGPTKCAFRIAYGLRL